MPDCNPYILDEYPFSHLRAVAHHSPPFWAYSDKAVVTRALHAALLLAVIPTHADVYIRETGAVSSSRCCGKAYWSESGGKAANEFHATELDCLQEQV